MGQLIHAGDVGALGYTIVTTGTISAGSNNLVVLDGAWKVGTGIGIVGAGASGGVLQTTVVSVSGKELTLADASATAVANSQVVSDDGPPLQAALDTLRTHGGGVLELDAGAYTIGVPNGPKNAPLFHGSNTFILGKHRKATTLRVCDNAKQLPMAMLTKYPSPLSPSLLKAYPNAALLVNYANTAWHANQPWPAQAAPFATPPDVDIGFANLTLDLNGVGQPYIGSLGNRSRLIKNTEYAYKLTGVAGGSLVSGHTYSVSITYIDSEGNETASNPAYQSITLAAGQNAIDVTFGLPPAGAVGAIAYIHDSVDPADTATYPDYPAGWVGPAWERLAIPGVTVATTTWHSNQIVVTDASGFNVGDTLYIPGAAAAGAMLTATITAKTGNTLTLSAAAGATLFNLTITKSVSRLLSHNSANNKCYPPGIGTVTKNGQDASVSYGFYIDNAIGVEVHDVDIINALRDGFALGILNSDSRQTYVPHPVVNARIRNVHVSGALRCGYSVTGEVDTVLFQNVVTEDCTLGLDVEVDGATAGMPTNNIVLQNCWFKDGFILNRNNVAGVGGVSLNPMENKPVRGITFDGCVFENLARHWGASINETLGSVIGCTFSRAWTNGAAFSSIGYGVFEGNTFYCNGRPAGVSPTYYYEANEGPDLILGLPARARAHCLVSGNSFIAATPHPGPHTAILISPGARGHIVENNFFDVVQTQPYDPTRDVNANMLRILVEGHIGDHRIGPNMGHYMVEDFRTGFSTPRVVSMLGTWPSNVQRVRHDAEQLGVPVQAGAAYLDVAFNPAIVPSGVIPQAPSALPAYRPEVVFGWDHGGWWVSNKTHSGFRINWHNPPPAASSLDWCADYSIPHLVSVDITPASPVTVAHGASVSFVSTGHFSDGSTAPMSGANLNWSVDPTSPNPTAASITTMGVLKAIAAGVVHVVATPPAYATSKASNDAGPTPPNLPRTITVNIT